MIVKFKRLTKTATLPAYQTTGASGFDIVSDQHIWVQPGMTEVVKTGFAIEMPEANPPFFTELQIRPRGGVSYKTKLRIPNTPGTVDNDYRGELMVLVENIGERSIEIKPGMRIAQGVVTVIARCDIAEVGNLSETGRGEGRLGSTGGEPIDEIQ